MGLLFGNVLLAPDALTSDAIPSADIDRFFRLEVRLPDIGGQILAFAATGRGLSVAPSATSPMPIPLPGTLPLLVVGLFGLFGFARTARRRAAV